MSCTRSLIDRWFARKSRGKRPSPQLRRGLERLESRCVLSASVGWELPESYAPSHESSEELEHAWEARQSHEEHDGHDGELHEFERNAPAIEPRGELTPGFSEQVSAPRVPFAPLASRAPLRPLGSEERLPPAMTTYLEPIALRVTLPPTVQETLVTFAPATSPPTAWQAVIQATSLKGTSTSLKITTPPITAAPSRTAASPETPSPATASSTWFIGEQSAEKTTAHEGSVEDNAVEADEVQTSSVSYRARDAAWASWEGTRSRRSLTGLQQSLLCLDEAEIAAASSGRSPFDVPFEQLRTELENVDDMLSRLHPIVPKEQPVASSTADDAIAQRRDATPDAYDSTAIVIAATNPSEGGMVLLEMAAQQTPFDRTIEFIAAPDYAEAALAAVGRSVETSVGLFQKFDTGEGASWAPTSVQSAAPANANLNAQSQPAAPTPKSS
ncbi:MAG: hypothetical protein KDA61_14790 [Planctomycetales bacterium]|nr:hypothetical protein [Planctomycetales bacterium]